MSATRAGREPGSSQGRSVVVLGATSAIARAVATELAARGFDLIVAGRDLEDLRIMAADMRLRYGVAAVPLEFDALSFDTHARFLDECRAAASGSGLFGAVLCFGHLGDQAESEKDFAEARRTIETNFVGAVSILNLLAGELEANRQGFLSAISSVAGDRGRQSNYIYGAAKAGLTVYLQGLRNRLSRSGVRVITIKPGFVDTRMTFGRPGLFLVASPEAAGRRIVRAILAGTEVSYVPGFWRFVMFGIRAIPEKIFKKIRM